MTLTLSEIISPARGSSEYFYFTLSDLIITDTQWTHSVLLNIHVNILNVSFTLIYTFDAEVHFISELYSVPGHKGQFHF